MDWSTLKTRILTYLDNRSDIATAEIEEAINTAQDDVELDFNWRHMESKFSGNFTSSSDSISIPARYKMTKSLFVTVDNKQRMLRKMDYTALIRTYPDGTVVKNSPRALATLEADSKIYVRPYPDDTYPYELIVYAYSADLSDSNTSTWWMVNSYQVLLYGALLELRAYKNDDKQVAKWQTFYDRRIAKLRKVHIDEENTGSIQQMNPTYEVV